ncbi:hypothetical protein PF66_06425 [Pseudomonas asplenii]|uniref:Uncharacterized protein n=1 Tax=Pseudomonas asplenii TaxID=53407 RepID=A0A0M9GBM5_9PSED|nr:hypothetical protein [Pseudomonas fuscovaginae]KPA87080.1 hypothetical protein PF66_06425 [Pseudomonas fuscovaginae]
MKMFVGALAAGLLLSLVPLASNADWAKTPLRDEMRAIESLMYSQESSPILGQGPKLTLSVFDKNDGFPAVMLSIETGVVDGCPEQGLQTCDLQARFDNGEVRGLSFATRDGKRLTPTNSGAFSGAVIASKILYIELPIGGSIAQYRYELRGLEAKYIAEPSISFMGFELGGSYPEQKPNMEASGGEDGHTCYSGKNIQNVFSGVSVSKVTLCFYNDVFYQAFIVPGSKQAYAVGFSYLSKKFGKVDPDGVYPSWPADTGKLIRKNVRSASYLSVGKNKYDDAFIITDEALSLRVPKSQ